jgi:energy-coupling factor transporter transmembrane protein EcfT
LKAVTKPFILFIASILIISLAIAWLGMIIGFSFSIPFASYLLPSSKFMASLGVLNLFVALLLPLSAFALMFIRVFWKYSLPKKYKAGLFAFWLVNVASLGFVGTHISNYFINKAEYVEEIDLGNFNGDTLKVYQGKKELDRRLINFGDISFDNYNLSSENVDISFKPSSDNKFHIKKKIYARGSSSNNALQSAKIVNYNYEINNDEIHFNNYFQIKKGDKWRGQNIELIVEVPKNKHIFIERYMLDDIHMEGRDPAYDHGYQVTGKLWKNGEDGFLSPEYARKNNDLKIFDNKGFTKLEIEGSMKIEIEKSDQFYISINGNEKYTEKVDLVQLGETLHISLDKNKHHSSKPVRLKIKMPSLLSLDLTNTDDTKLSGFDEQKMNISNKGNYDIKAIMDVDELTVHLDGNNELDLKGEGKRMNITLDDYSRIDADRYKVLVADISANRFHEMQLNVIDTIYHNVREKHKMKVEGGPVMVDRIDVQ